MMTSSNGNIFRVTGHLCGEFAAPGEFPAQRPVTQRLAVFFDLRRINGWVNNEAGNLRRHRAHYDVIVMGASEYFRWLMSPVGHEVTDLILLHFTYILWFYWAEVENMNQIPMKIARLMTVGMAQPVENWWQRAATLLIEHGLICLG